MQLTDLAKPIEASTDEELLARLRVIRHQRITVRPAAIARTKRGEKKTSNKKVNALGALLAGLTEAERKQLIVDLGGDNE